MSQTKKLIFVHNADSGYMSAVIDGLHKSLRPSTYQCDLCALTYGAVKMKKQWKDFINKLPVSVDIFHKNDFYKKYPDKKFALPAVFSLKDSALKIEVSAEQFAKFDDLEDLIQAVQKITAS